MTPQFDNSPLFKLPPRAADSHKGTFGHALLIGGSRGMAGAIALAGMATLRSGAGLVRVGIPESLLATVAAFDPCLMTAPLPETPQGLLSWPERSAWTPLLDAATVVAIGPGLGKSWRLVRLVQWLYTTLPVPLVLDADALNALAEIPEVLSLPAGPRVLTPHPGEFARLQKCPPLSADSTERAKAAESLAQRSSQLTVVLKGHRTLIAQGTRLAENSSGNPGMATGGSGDVLTGIVTGLLAQGLAPYDAARLAVWLHGRAGDLAAAKLGQISLTARDLIDFLPQAFQEHQK